MTALPPLPRWRRASLRWLRRHPWQLGLAVVGIALGVAVMVAVDLATASARRAFDLSMEQVTGDASHRIVGAPTGLDESFYRTLRIELGVRSSAPVVEGFAEADGETLRVLGVDPLAPVGPAGRLADVEGAAFERLLTDPGTALLAGITARRFGIGPGDSLTVSIAGLDINVHVIGLFEPDTGPAAAVDGLLVADIATVQEWFDRVGRLDAIDLELDDGQAEALRAELPAALELESSDTRRRQAQQLTAAFRTNLRAMGLLAVVIGVFLIYNTMTFSVIQRRRLIGTLRALGVTRGQVVGQVVGETLLLGAVGTAVGLVAGVFVAQGLVGLVTRTINDLYFVLTVTTLFPSAAELAQGAAIGLAAALAGALGPAMEAAGAAPDAAGRRSIVEQRSHRLVPALAVAGVVLVAGALALLQVPGGGLVAGFGALFLLVIGGAALMPGALLLVVPPLARAARRPGGPLASMATRGITAALSRTGLAVIALAIALSAIVGIEVMITSFRGTVSDWLQRTLAADVYVTAPQRVAARHFAALPASVPGRVAAVDGVAATSTGWRVLVDGTEEPVPLQVLDPVPASLDSLRLKAGDRATAFARFRAGDAVLVSEPWSVHKDVGPGDRVTLRTDRGMRDVPIAGVYYDYNTDRGVVLMHRALFAQWWDDARVSAVGVYLEPDATLETVMTRIREVVAGTGPVDIQPSAAIRERSLAIFDRTFAITGVLRTLALGVAFVGVLTALLALQLERGRELAILRATGATPGQVRGMVLTQTLVLGALAGLFALPLGLALAEVLIEVINQRAFGWSITTTIPWSTPFETLLLAIGAAALAGAWPAWRAGRIEPVEALREE
ncbi:MAG: FtsX-like permease family protein [Halofilum sp. (in: g-proteobacteria)]|nr:FtsX-like permease family protein [Halofilum sp. (in: g-proteobacteria)]